MRTLVLLAALAGSLFASSTSEQLASQLSGTFTNLAQSRGDSNFRRVVVHCTRIWADRDDGIWLYFEQALSEAPDEPFRQLVYRIEPGAGDSLRLVPYSVPNPIALTNAWKTPATFAKLTPAELSLRENCILEIKPTARGFGGQTLGQGCPGELRGADYSVTEIAVTETTFTLWERGFTRPGRQIWGDISGGYRFERLAEPSRPTEKSP